MPRTAPRSRGFSGPFIIRVSRRVRVGGARSKCGPANGVCSCSSSGFDFRRKFGHELLNRDDPVQQVGVAAAENNAFICPAFA